MHDETELFLDEYNTRTKKLPGYGKVSIYGGD